MSWLARSFVNSLRIDDDDDDDDKNFINERKTESGKDREEEQHHQIESSEPQGRGVKEDFSELTKTLTRQLWGVASFLAPPPSSEHSPPSSPSPPPRQASSTDPSISDWNRWESPDQSLYAEASDPPISDSPRIAGIRNDFAEIGGKFKTGISKLSNNKAVSEISKIASTFLTPFGSEGESDDMHSVGGAVGVTDEVLTYARNIAMHPETWLDFPLADDEDSDDFNMSDAQQEHALAVEHLTPRLTALRIELCPSHMSEGCFWKIYFVLLHSRLNKHDAELLSTPQIVEARAMLMQELQNRTKPEPDWSGRGMSYRSEARSSLQEECLSASSNTFSETIPVKTFSADHTTFIPATDFETEKHPVVSTEMRIVDKSVVEERPAIQNKKKDLLIGASSKILDQKFEPEEDGDDWLEEDNSEIGGFSGTTIPLGHDEDVSFSDLEDDDGSVPTSSKTVSYVSDSSTKESRGWVQLSRSTAESGKHDQSLDIGCLGSEQSHGNNSETKDSSDWLSVDEVDVV